MSVSYPDEISARYETGKHIDHYNMQRPHQSLWNFTPHHIHKSLCANISETLSTQ